MKNQDIKDKLIKVYSQLETPHVLNSILSDCETQKGVFVMENKKNYWMKGLALACAVVLLVIGLNVTTLFNSNQVVTTVAFDVNPSIELEMNEKEEVVKANALNEDGQKVLDGMKLEGVDLDVAVNALVGSMIKQGYLNEIANSILVSVNSSDAQTANRLQNELMEEISELIRENQLDGAILTQRLDLDDEEIEELAKVYGITKAKTQLIKEILKVNSFHSFEDLVSLSIHDLNLICQSSKEELQNVTSSGVASESKYIGSQTARDIALKDAQVTTSQVSELEIELDYEMGKMIYEVEFIYNNIEYDYDIDATEGTILHVDKEKKSSSSSNAVAPTTKIGKEKAKEIAFKDASVNESQVSDLWIELDDDDDEYVYEVEFHVGKAEYEYKIHAETGKIVEKEVEGSTSTSSSYIGEDKAKKIAFDHASVNESQIRKCHVELDDGIYEIEFHVGNVEYEYEINAKTGAVLKVEKH